MNTIKERGNTLLVILVAIIVIAGCLGALLIVASGGHNSDPNACVNKTLSSGDKGDCVSEAQYLANWSAFGIEGKNYIPITGTFDAATETAVKTAQKNNSLPVSGKIDAHTWKQLCNTKDAPMSIVAAGKAAGC